MYYERRVVRNMFEYYFLQGYSVTAANNVGKVPSARGPGMRRSLCDRMKRLKSIPFTCPNADATAGNAPSMAHSGLPCHPWQGIAGHRRGYLRAAKSCYNANAASPVLWLTAVLAGFTISGKYICRKAFFKHALVFRPDRN